MQQLRLTWLVLVLFAVGIMSIGIVGCGTDEEAPKKPTESTSTESSDDEEVVVASRDPIDFDAEKKAIQAVYADFYNAFNDNDIKSIADTFNTSLIQFGTIFAENEPVPVAEGWNDVKSNIEGLWIGIGTAGGKWGQNSTLSKFWIRYKGSSLEASALGFNCYKGAYPGETHLYLIKKKDEWFIQQLDSITQNNLNIFGLQNTAKPRIQKFFDDDDDLAP